MSRVISYVGRTAPHNNGFDALADNIIYIRPSTGARATTHSFLLLDGGVEIEVVGAFAMLTAAWQTVLEQAVLTTFPQPVGVVVANQPISVNVENPTPVEIPNPLPVEIVGPEILVTHPAAAGPKPESEAA